MASQVVSGVETTEETRTNTILFYPINTIPPIDTGHSQKAQFIQSDYIVIGNEASEVLS